MGLDYAQLGKLAANLLCDFGQSISIKRSNETRYDPENGTNTVVTSHFTGYGCAFHYSSHEIDGSRILTGDMVVLLENIATAPEIGDMVTVNNTDMRVISVECLSPANINLLYKLQVRK